MRARIACCSCLEGLIIHLLCEQTILAAGSIIQDHSDMDVALVKYRVAAVKVGAELASSLPGSMTSAFLACLDA